MLDPVTNLPSEISSLSLRDNSLDALYGSILAVESVLGLLLAHQALTDTDPAASLRSLRLRIQALHEAQIATRYGTGAEQIADGVQDSLDSIFHRAQQLLHSAAPDMQPKR